MMDRRSSVARIVRFGFVEIAGVGVLGGRRRESFICAPVTMVAALSWPTKPARPVSAPISDVLARVVMGHPRAGVGAVKLSSPPGPDGEIEIEVRCKGAEWISMDR